MYSTDAVIEDFLDAEQHAWGEMDMRTFAGIPNIFEYDPLFAVEWTERVISVIDTASKADLSSKRIAECLYNPSTIRATMQFDLLSAKLARAGVASYMKIFNFYISALSAICIEDPSTKEGKSVVHAERVIAEKRKKCTSGSAIVGKALGRLSTACYSLSHGLFGDMNPQLVYDNFGPYYQKDHALFAIKTFGNLRPVELWPETVDVPVEYIEICMLMENVTMTMDITSHAVYTGNQVEGLRAWSCTADGKKLTVEDIDSLRTLLERIAIDVFTKTKEFSVEEKKLLYCHQKAWCFKKLCEALGLDWRPSQEILRKMKDQRLFDRWNIDPETGALRASIRDILDPRKEIPAIAFRS